MVSLGDDLTTLDEGQVEDQPVADEVQSTEDYEMVDGARVKSPNRSRETKTCRWRRQG